MEKHKKVIAFFLSLLMVLSTIVVPENTKKVHAVSGDDFDVNSAWTLSQDITSEHTAREKEVEPIKGQNLKLGI